MNRDITREPYEDPAVEAERQKIINKMLAKEASRKKVRDNIIREEKERKKIDPLSRGISNIAGIILLEINIIFIIAYIVLGVGIANFLLTLV